MFTVQAARKRGLSGRWFGYDVSVPFSSSFLFPCLSRNKIYTCETLGIDPKRRIRTPFQFSYHCQVVANF